MAGHCVAGWLLTKQKRQNGASSIDVVDYGGKNDCGAHCGCYGQIGIVVDGERHREDDAVLRDDLIYEDEFELMLLKLLPLNPVFPRRLFVL